jgi:hypothetical protein
MVFLITSLFAFILKAGGDYNIAGIKPMIKNRPYEQ